jgi:hypothetical protein
MPASLNVESAEFGSVSTDDLNIASPTPTGVLGSRSLGTWYQNTTGKDLHVAIVLINDGAGGGILAVADINDSQLNNAVNKAEVGGSGQFRESILLKVPDQHYYRMRSFETESVDEWKEWTLS